MTTIRQLIHSSPKKANELFAKLVDTSDNAVKTRDRLFSELKDELELHAALEEQHLFPVLKKHKETKDLAAEAQKDNRQTRKLLSELENTPKDSEAFGTKVAELQKAFQQHVRDEKKELLPAVMKALSDEEASSVVENIEDEKAQVEAAQQAESDERREKARREREQAEAAKAAKEKAKAGAERVQKGTVARNDDDETGQSEAARGSDAERAMAGAADRTADIVEAGADMTQQSANVTRMVARAGADSASEMSKAALAAADSEETQESVSAGQSMVVLLSEQARHAMQTTMAVGRARTLSEVAQAQSDFIGGSFRRMGQFNQRYLAYVRGGMTSGSFPSSHR